MVVQEATARASASTLAINGQEAAVQRWASSGSWLWTARGSCPDPGHRQLWGL